jgi:hypothetical protein
LGAGERPTAPFALCRAIFTGVVWCGVVCLGLLNCCNPGWAQWHRLSLPHEQIMAMPPKRRSLFRGIWQV